jgi:hypothetical protein
MESINGKAIDGTLTAAEWNQLPTEIQNIITDLGIALSNGDLDQLGKAIAGMVGSADYYSVGGTVNALTATKIGAKQAPVALDAVHDGLRVRLRPSGSNTGAATINVNAISVKDIKRENGDALTAGDLSPNRDAIMRYDSGTDDFFLLDGSLPLLDVVPRGYIDGFITGPDPGDTANDILIKPGIARATNIPMTLDRNSNIIKQLDANWAFGSGVGGFPSGLSITLNTWYHIFMIGHPNGNVDAGVDSNLDASQLLADASGYTGYRRIGAIRWESGPTMRQYTQIGDHFIWDEYYMEVDATQSGAGLTAYALSRVPLGVRVEPKLTIGPQYNSAEQQVAYGDGDAVLATALGVGYHDTLTYGASTHHSEMTPRLITDLSQQIQIRRAGTIDLELVNHGWVDPRGRTIQ